MTMSPEPTPSMRGEHSSLSVDGAVWCDVGNDLPTGHGHRVTGPDVVLASVGVPLGTVRERDGHPSALGVRDRETVPASARLLQYDAVAGLLHGRVDPVVRLHGLP